MKPAWQEDLETDEAGPYIDAILTGLLVIGTTIICTVALGFVLRMVWPYLGGWM